MVNLTQEWAEWKLSQKSRAEVANACVDRFCHLQPPVRRLTLHFVSDKVGELTLPLTMEGTSPTRQAVHLLSAVVRVKTRYVVVNNAQTCAEAVTSPEFP